jgi:hypothetical protein
MRQRENCSTSRWPFRFERRTASASARRIRIHDVKSGSGQAIAKIQSRAPQKRSALRVDEKMDAVALHHCVTGAFFIERHFVLQSGTTAFGDLHPQAFACAIRLGFKQTFELADSVVRDCDHPILKRTMPPDQVNRSALVE